MRYTTYYQSQRRPNVQPAVSGQIYLGLRRHHLARGVALVVIIVVGLLLFNTRSSHASAHATVKQYSKTQTVCIDPGHGGSDPGAVTADGTITERDINLIVAQRVQKTLETSGYRVFMTRTTNDQTLSNHDRYTYCNEQNATVMISIHHNDFEDSSVDYATALFYKDQDQALSTSVLSSVASKLAIENDGIAQFEDGVLSESKMPAALSEGFFITSDVEYGKLTAAGSTRLNDEADAIATGITSYLTQPASKRPVINKDPQVIERDDTGP